MMQKKQNGRSSKKIFISYDKEADVMYLSFDESAKAEAEEIDDNVFARYKSKIIRINLRYSGILFPTQKLKDPINIVGMWGNRLNKEPFDER